MCGHYVIASAGKMPTGPQPGWLCYNTDSMHGLAGRAGSPLSVISYWRRGERLLSSSIEERTRVGSRKIGCSRSTGQATEKKIPHLDPLPFGKGEAKSSSIGGQDAHRPHSQDGCATILGGGRRCISGFGPWCRW